MQPINQDMDWFDLLSEVKQQIPSQMNNHGISATSQVLQLRFVHFSDNELFNH